MECIMNSFETWLKQCDRVTRARLHGISLHDMVDASWMDYFEDGLSPEDAVESAINDYWRGDMS